MARIGVAGLGRMGAAMAARLLDCGHELVVWNRSPGRSAALEAMGATVAATPRALAEQAEVIITILTDAAAVEAVHGDMLVGSLAGKLVIEMSTVQPATPETLASRIAAAGAEFVACPVGGTIGPARNGKLLGLAGSSAAAVARARPVLDQLCRRVEHVGDVGAGAAMKLAVNLPLALYYQALAEAVTLCGHLGHDPDWLMELFADTTGGSNVLKVRGPGIAKALRGEDTGPISFDIDGIRKDMRTMLAEAAARGATLPVTQATLAIYDQASAAGWGAKDGATLPAFWPSRNPGA